MSYSSFEELKILKFSGLFHCSVIKFLTCRLMRQLIYIIISSVTCQQLFSFVLTRLISVLIVQDRLCWLAERMGFEPMRPWRQTVFKTASLWPLRYPCMSQLILNCLVVCTCSAQDLYYHQCYNMSTLISNFFTFFCVSLKKVLQSPYLQELWPLYFHTSPLWALLLCHSHTLLSLHHP